MFFCAHGGCVQLFQFFAPAATAVTVAAAIPTAPVSAPLSNEYYGFPYLPLRVTFYLR